MKTQKMINFIVIIVSLCLTAKSTFSDNISKKYHSKSILKFSDFNGDGKVNYKDIALLKKHMWSHSGHYRYHPIYDRNTDGRIDRKDRKIVYRDFGKKVPLQVQQIALATQASMKYYGNGGLDCALNDGFLPFTPELKGHGVHYVRFDKIDNVFNIEDIEGLNFLPDGQLVAIFYLRTVNNLEELEFPYNYIVHPNDDHPYHVSFDNLKPHDWHSHLFAYFTGLGSRDWRDITFSQNHSFPDEIIELGSDKNTGEEIEMFPNSDVILSDKFWMIHLWSHSINPNGLFANTHPEVSPDAPDEHGGH